MEFSPKSTTLLLILILFLSSGHCDGRKSGHHSKHKPGHPIIKLPPIHLPSVPIPPITVPPIKPPKVHLPPVTGAAPAPVTGGGGKGKPSCPPPPAKKDTCPIDTLKLGACVDLLGGVVHIGLGDPVINRCCPIIAGLVGVEAAACLCTTLKVKALNLNFYVPLALELLITCGKTPPPGYTCSI